MSNTQQFNDWWQDFKSQHDEWRFADKEALLYQAYLAGGEIDRDSVIEECAKFFDLDDTALFFGGRVAEELRSRKSQPAQPDPRDEALRLAREALTHAQNQAYPFGGLELFAKALAAIDEVLKGDN